MRVPSYRKHSSGRARVTIAGRDYLLGQFGSDESKVEYRRLIAEYVASNCSPVFGEKASRLTMSQIATAYLDFAKTYYKGSSEYVNLELAVRPISYLYEHLLASKFGPAEFKACRGWWLEDSTRSRQYVNKQAKRLLRIIKWAVAEGLMPAVSYQGIKCVEPLRFGRSTAPEASPIRPVADDVVEATVAHLSPVVADMVRFQQATGCRPGEVCKIKPGMVDRSQEVWEVHLAAHKTAYKGKARTIYCGPNAQAILIKYMLRDSDAHCFSAAESAKQHRQRRHANRKTPMSCGNKPGSNVVDRARQKEPGECFTSMSYAHAIKYACVKAFPAPKSLSPHDKKAWFKSHQWAPNQIRHSTATKIRKEFGLEATASILGHSEIGVTQVYAEADKQRAVEVARRIG